MTSTSSRSVVFLILLIADIASITRVAFLNERETDTLLGRERDDGFFSSTNAENVGETGSEGVATGILDVSNLVGTGMVLDVLEHTDATNIVTASGENAGAIFELDNRVNFVGLKVELKKAISKL